MLPATSHHDGRLIVSAANLLSQVHGFLAPYQGQRIRASVSLNRFGMVCDTR